MLPPTQQRGGGNQVGLVWSAARAMNPPPLGLGRARGEPNGNKTRTHTRPFVVRLRWRYVLGGAAWTAATVAKHPWLKGIDPKDRSASTWMDVNVGPRPDGTKDNSSVAQTLTSLHRPAALAPPHNLPPPTRTHPRWGGASLPVAAAPCSGEPAGRRAARLPA